MSAALDLEVKLQLAAANLGSTVRVEPNIQERVCVLLDREASGFGSVAAPCRGWYVGTVVRQRKATDALDLWVEIQWDNPGVFPGQFAGRFINLQKHPWFPYIDSENALPEDTAEQLWLPPRRAGTRPWDASREVLPGVLADFCGPEPELPVKRAPGAAAAPKALSAAQCATASAVGKGPSSALPLAAPSASAASGKRRPPPPAAQSQPGPPPQQAALPASAASGKRPRSAPPPQQAALPSSAASGKRRPPPPSAAQSRSAPPSQEAALPSSAASGKRRPPPPAAQSRPVPPPQQAALPSSAASGKRRPPPPAAQSRSAPPPQQAALTAGEAPPPQAALAAGSSGESRPFVRVTTKSSVRCKKPAHDKPRYDRSRSRSRSRDRAAEKAKSESDAGAGAPEGGGGTPQEGSAEASSAGDSNPVAPASPLSWLHSAADVCRCGDLDRRYAALAQSLRRWWLEARAGLARVSSTPPQVFQLLQEQQSARRFVLDHLGDESFWDAVNSGRSFKTLAELGAPASLLRAIRRARTMGAAYFSSRGVFAAPSRTVPGEYGVYALIAFFPGEFIGEFTGSWYWGQKVDSETWFRPVPLRGGRGKKQEARPLEAFPNAAALLRYAVHFSQVDTDGSRRFRVMALVDPCRGQGGLTMESVANFGAILALVNEPPPGATVNCESHSRVHANLPLGHKDRYSVQVAAVVPLLPMQELHIDYGRSYERSYERGCHCPTLFQAAPVGCLSLGICDARASPLLPADLVEGGPEVPRERQTASASSSSRLVPSPQQTDASSPAWSLAPVYSPCRGDRLGDLGLPAASPPPRLGDVLFVRLGAPAFTPAGAKAQRTSVVSSPYAGWFEAVVTKANLSGGSIEVVWSDVRVNGGQRSVLKLSCTAWTPAPTASASREDARDAQIEEVHDPQRPQECLRHYKQREIAVAERSRGWIVAAADAIDSQSLGERLVFVRWWIELRRGVARIALTPPSVFGQLRHLHDARRYVKGLESEEDVRPAGERPLALRATLDEAYRMGATRIYLHHGLFEAPSGLRYEQIGLFSLVLRYPAECIADVTLRDGGLRGPLSENGDEDEEEVRSMLRALGHPVPVKPGIRGNCLLCAPSEGLRDRIVLATSLPILPLCELNLDPVPADYNDPVRRRGPFADLPLVDFAAH